MKREIDQLMDKLEAEKKRVMERLIKRIYSLEVGEELFQCYLAVLPPADALKETLNENDLGRRFEIWTVLNGTMVRRIT